MRRISALSIEGRMLAIGFATTAAAPTEAGPRPHLEAADAIIVTARTAEERLQDVPISVTVFNQEEISNGNIATASDLGTYPPSLSAMFGSFDVEVPESWTRLP